jgi:hypothetical protein
VSDADRIAAARANAAAASTLVGLHRALKARLAEIAAPFWWLETKSTRREPQIVDGWLAPKTSAVEDFPFLIARPVNGIDSQQGAGEDSTATFDVLIGTYSDADEGFLDVLAILDAIRDSLGADPVIGGAFEHVGPIGWRVPEEQARPQWMGVATLVFLLPRPQRVDARNPTE